MDLTQTLSEGLKREFKVVLPVVELEERLTNELAQLKDRVQLKGFRPGKVPASHIRRLYGRSIVGDIIEKAVSEANEKIIKENDFRLALQPKVSLPESKEEVEDILDVKKGLDFTVAFEILPKFDIVDISDVELTKEVVDITDEDVTKTLDEMSRNVREYEEKNGVSEDGDRLNVDFVGTIDGEAFQGGSAEGMAVDLGSKTFIPGFEEQLVGLKAGDKKTVKVTFPENYLDANLAGKDAEFAVTVHKVEAPKDVEINDELAKKLGSENVETLKKTIREFLDHDNSSRSRQRMKKKLLDILDEKYSFDLPEGLVSQEFDGIWQQIQGDLKSSGKTFEDEGTTEEEAKKDYQKIAERRVRLGLVLAEIGEKNQTQVSDEDVSKALISHVQQFPGQERQVWEYYRNNPSALAQIRAPLFEEKVVDHLLSLIKLNEVTVTRDDLLAEDEDEEKKPAEKTKESKAKSKSSSKNADKSEAKTKEKSKSAKGKSSDDSAEEFDPTVD